MSFPLNVPIEMTFPPASATTRVMSASSPGRSGTRSVARTPFFRVPKRSISRRKRSLSVTIPTSFPSSTTGKPPMLLSTSIRAASSTSVCEVMVITLRVMTLSTLSFERRLLIS